MIKLRYSTTTVLYLPASSFPGSNYLQFHHTYTEKSSSYGLRGDCTRICGHLNWENCVTLRLGQHIVPNKHEEYLFMHK